MTGLAGREAHADYYIYEGSEAARAVLVFVPGLTPAGRRLVQRCNELRIMLDVSHLNERGFWDVLEVSTAPVVASHSCCRATRSCVSVRDTRSLRSGRRSSCSRTMPSTGAGRSIGATRGSPILH